MQALVDAAFLERDDALRDGEEVLEIGLRNCSIVVRTRRRMRQKSLRKRIAFIFITWTENVGELLRQRNILTRISRRQANSLSTNGLSRAFSAWFKYHAHSKGLLHALQRTVSRRCLAVVGRSLVRWQHHACTSGRRRLKSWALEEKISKRVQAVGLNGWQKDHATVRRLRRLIKWWKDRRAKVDSLARKSSSSTLSWTHRRTTHNRMCTIK